MITLSQQLHALLRKASQSHVKADYAGQVVVSVSYNDRTGIFTFNGAFLLEAKDDFENDQVTYSAVDVFEAEPVIFPPNLPTTPTNPTTTPATNPTTTPATNPTTTPATNPTPTPATNQTTTPATNSTTTPATNPTPTPTTNPTPTPTTNQNTPASV